LAGAESQWQLAERVPFGDLQRAGEVARAALGQQPVGRGARVPAVAPGRVALVGAGRQQNRECGGRLVRRPRLASLAQPERAARAARGARRRAQRARRPPPLQVRRQRATRARRQNPFLHGRGQNPTGLEFEHRTRN